MPCVRLLIVSENISMRMGGESGPPFYYAKLFSQRGAEVWPIGENGAVSRPSAGAAATAATTMELPRSMTALS